MRIITVCIVCAYVSIVSAAPADKKVTKYTTKYDYIDVDSILRSNRLLKNYMECILERGPCTREGLELKRNIPDALATDCSKCSERQKKMAGKVMGYLLQNQKNYWNQLLDKYDPTGKFRKRYHWDSDDEDDEEYKK